MRTRCATLSSVGGSIGQNLGVRPGHAPLLALLGVGDRAVTLPQVAAGLSNLLRYVAPVLPMLAVSAGALIARIPFRGIRIAIGLFAVALLVLGTLAAVEEQAASLLV